MNRTLVRLTAAAFAVAAMAAGPPATAVQPPSHQQFAPAASPEMLEAMKRDLGLSSDQASARIAKDIRASALGAAFDRRLGDRFGGAWLTPDAELVVAVTDQADAALVRAAGAEPRVVTRSEDVLDAAKFRLDGLRAPATVSGWAVDVKTNSVVVYSQPSALAEADRFVADAGVDRSLVRLEASTDSPRLLADVRGGDAYYINNSSRCSVGFSVNGGFVTAGHCGRVGAPTTGADRTAQGTFRGSVFPGSGDYGWVATNSNWTPRGVVNNYAGGTVAVAGSQESAVGASICRSGSTTGWKCGTVQAKNQSVTYPEGTITGLTRTNACAEPGDSGGSWLTGQQAQGVTSGGSGNCTSGGTTFFQPVNEILSAYSLTLVTSGGGDPDPEPPVDCIGMQAWASSTGYVPGDVVSHNAHKWESTYWSTGAEPGDPGSWAVWKDVGPC
ncbi:alpha-lytic protease prodomain-containing protein [Amycolatopsis nigrescens]|uniref:alpha-lytic protease prodomain-containing protein n=1 Tax=Amycolatopsis nigrescens TaxID=381445 RepID=UPI00037571D5|nr:alpha-lytic protease prodomain-containing protein [Amycolatopsis nigrescens]